MEEMKWSSSSFLGVMWLQTTFVLAWLWLKSAILWPVTVPRGHGMSKISHAEPS
jgi:hypothetical protein